MATFDKSFDRTFGVYDTPDGNTPTQMGCRRSGVYLTWLTVQGGWMYWLFEGSIQRGQQVSVKGQARQNRLNRPTQKETSPTYVIHTSGLTKEDAEAVGTLRESVSIYWLIHNDDGSIEEVEVTIPDGEAQLWDSQTYTHYFSTTITLPGRPSQRL